MVSVLRLAAATSALTLLASPAFAYIGPGAGLSVVAAFWALLTAVVSSLLFLVLWPLRNRLRRRKAAREAARTEGRLAAPQPQLAQGAPHDHRR